MKIRELKVLLNKYDENLDIGFVSSFIEHSCHGDEFCYCSAKEQVFCITNISDQWEKDKKTKEAKIVKVFINGDLE